MLDASVSMSIEKDGYKAGKEVAKEALGGLNSKPKLAILAVDSLPRRAPDYPAILRGVNEVLGEDVTLIGSSVNGMLVNGRFALRSVGLMLLGGDINIDTAYNYSGSRVDYKKIASELYDDIKNLEPKDNRLMLMFQDGIKLSQKVLDKQKSLNSRFVSMFTGLVRRMFIKQIEEFKQLGTGMPSVQEFLEELYSKGLQHPVIGNMASNIRGYDSVEFFNDKIGGDNIVGAMISGTGSTQFGLGYAAGAEPTGKKCTIDKNIGSFLLKIDGKPALVGLCSAAGIKKESLKELRGGAYLNYHTIIGTKERIGNEDVIHLNATITNPDLENMVVTGFPFDYVPKNMELFQSNMKILHKTAKHTVSQALEKINNPKFLLGFDCAIRFVAYGDNLPKISKTIDETIGKDIPRMIVGSGGEIFGTKDVDYYQNNFTFVTLAGGD